MTLPTLQSEIRACRRCVDAGFLSECRPLTEGQAQARVLLIGQAPSRTDHETGQFYSGPAGKKLRGWLCKAGFHEADFGTTIYAAAMTKCFPGRKPGSSKDRVPSRQELALCRPWLDAEWALVQPRLVVLFGGLAIQTFLSKEPLEELIGQAFEREGVWYVPFPHSSGASTWLNDPAHGALLTQALGVLKELRERLL